MKDAPSSLARKLTRILRAALTVGAVAGSLVSGSWAQTETDISDVGISYAGVIFDAPGNLYGVTEFGGSGPCLQGCGTVFQLTPNPGGFWPAYALYVFQGLSDGSRPVGGLVFDSSGNLYGTAQVGGTGGGGTVFKLSPGTNGSWVATTLYSFNATNDALYPNSSLIFDRVGNLYGTTAAGGKYGRGTIFRLSPTSKGPWKETVLHSFGGPGGDGSNPNGPLVMDAQNNIFGTTSSGGAATLGIAFALSHNPTGGWIETVLHSFHGTKDGGQPLAGLLLDDAHNLYGTAFNGGTFGYGGVFRLSRVGTGGQSNWKAALLYSFTNGTDGANPASPLAHDAAGNLYGATDGGFPTGCNSFYGCGQVFKLSPNSGGPWSLSALYPVPNFIQPNGGLVLDSSGNIFGTSVDNHYFNYGDVFEVTQ